LLSPTTKVSKVNSPDSKREVGFLGFSCPKASRSAAERSFTSKSAEKISFNAALRFGRKRDSIVPRLKSLGQQR
jgi:hypothetical protein